MLSVLSRFQSTIIAVLFLALLGANVFFLQSPILGVFLLVFWLFFFGALAGQAVGPKETPALSWWLGILVLLSSVMILGSVAFYLHSYPAPVSWSLALLSVPFALWLGRGKKTSWLNLRHDLVHEKEHRIPPAVFFSGAIILLLAFFVLQSLVEGATTEAIRTPWLGVSPALFVAVFLLFLLLMALLLRGRERALSLPLVSITLFLFLCVALLTFPIGYGFDSFIHQATESHIAEHGTITPKPLYYVGQYTLVLFLHHVFALPVQILDAFLVPILSALLLPMAFYSAAAHLSSSKRFAAAALSGLFLLPLTSFIVTTPQGLANLWTLLIILAGVPYMLRLESPRIFALLLFSGAAISVHPIAGIPAVLFVALLASDPSRANAKLKIPSSLLFWTILGFGSVVLPASFVANSLVSGSGLGLDLSALTLNAIGSALHIDLFFENRFNPILDFVYLYGYNAILLLFAFGFLGWFFHRNALAGRLRVLIGMLTILAINFFLLSTAVDFSFLIDYERLNYAARLVPLMAFFLVPFVLLFLTSFFARINTAPVVIRAASVLLFAALATSAFYFTYPRDDAYETSHGFNVSQSDVSAVYAIEDEAAGSAYAVLANQSVSAAAIRTLGFTRYWGDVFFYPVPTGGELYETFLRMNDAPSTETAERARLLIASACERTQCETDLPEAIFYVVNKYWWQSDRIIETAKNTADAWFAVGDGDVYIFQYNVTDSASTPPTDPHIF